MSDDLSLAPAPGATSAVPVPPSIPGPARPRRERLPGTYAGSYLHDDPSPSVGASVLGGLCAVAFEFEFIRLFAEIFSGYTTEADVFAVVRVALVSLTVVLVWVGLGWVRWVLAAGGYIFGAGLLVATLMQGTFTLMERTGSLASIPLGFIYLAIGVYIGFSANVVAFAKEQRKAGGPWLSVVPVVVLCGLCVAGLFPMRFLCDLWALHERQEAFAFADESVRAIAEHWDPAVFDQRADPEYVARWPVEAKRSVFATMAERQGAIRRMDGHNLDVRVRFDVATGFHWLGFYTSRNTMERSRGNLGLELKRGLFTPWRITAWSYAPAR